MSLGGWEIPALVIVALLLFGSKRVPELFRSLGQGLREFKKSVSGVGEEIAPTDEEKDSSVK
jgi:sec-independent protein translocase protein TatA